MASDLKDLEWGHPEKTKDHVEEQAGLINRILNQRNGVGWEEANIAVQEVMSDYVGAVRSKTLLDQAWRNLNQIKQKASRLLQACNGHELGRCLEVLNLIEVGEAVCYAASKRQETRKGHYRSDFPFTNPLLDLALLVRKKNGKLVSRWKNVKL
jgi:succinate dehydrogenase/fumarate reductase flavoprotein subunit